MVNETRLHPSELILPIFLVEGNGQRQEIASMPGVLRYSLDTLDDILLPAIQAKIGGVLLFGLTEHKDEEASSATAADSLVSRAVRQIKAEYPALIVMTDVCVCAYTPHGHCGVLKNGVVENDLSLDLLASMALSHALAGADVVAPSAMMDGQVAAIREALDDAGLASTAILAYAAKFQSSFYGPFRDAADSSPQQGDRASYQMNPGNANEAMLELEADELEGADMLMVKPAWLYLDIVYRAAQSSHLPVVAYNVSGEFSMLKAAAANGWLDEKKTVWEAAVSVKRAGAKLIITYDALLLAELCASNNG